MNVRRPVTREERDVFYRAAVLGLRALDAHESSGRRFGEDAASRWASFRGALTDADRLDLLIRDAAATWGVAFSAAEVFGLFGLAPDEPFGPEWSAIPPSDARRLIVDGEAAPRPETLGARMGVESAHVELPAITPSTRLALAGGSALVAVASVFAARSELSWADQVLAVATSPVHRQLAGLLAILAGATRRTRVTRPGEDVRSILTSAGFAQVDVAVISTDAEAACAAFARRAAGVA